MTSMSFHLPAHGLPTGILGRISEVVSAWRRRAEDRAQLAKWDERDLHDAGISRAVLEYELNKPFWRG